MGQLSAFVFGGTGTIGGGIVRALAKHEKFTKVTLFGRRKMDLEESADYQKFDQQLIHFDTLDQLDPSTFNGYDVGFYALGVSSAKVDEATYRKVEHDYTMKIAGVIKAAGVPHLTYVSGRGADHNSWFLFGKVKAQVEDELTALEFPRLSIIQPAAVLSSDSRLTLCLTKCLDKNHKISIDNDTLGKAIVENTLLRGDGPREVLTMGEISKILKESP